MHIIKVVKNKTTAHFCMKRKRKILLRIVFLISALFYSGINAYSNYNVQPNQAEIASGLDCEEDNCISDVDFFDDEQINPAFEFKARLDLKYQVPIKMCTLIFRCYSSIWQPPQSK